MTTEQQQQEPVKTNSRRSWLWRTSSLVIVLIGGLAGLLLTISPRNNASSLRGGNVSGENCPTSIEYLDEHGMVINQNQVFGQQSSSTVAAVQQPDCKTNKDDSQGTYFEFQVPDDGQVTLEANALLVDACTCIILDSPTVSVVAGQSLRVWVPLDNPSRQPLQFTSTTTANENCPKGVEQLDENGMINPGTERYDDLASKPVSCVSSSHDEEQVGMYFEWKASTDGQVTLADSTRVVNEECKCATTTITDTEDASSTTFDVAAGQVVRIWTPIDDIQPLQFTSLQQPANEKPQGASAPSDDKCPKNVDLLQENGTLQEGLFVDYSGELVLRPTCRGDAKKDETLQGLFFDWTAPARGHVMLASHTVGVYALTCECVSAPRGFRIESGELLRVWTPLGHVQPLEFIRD